MYKPLSNAAYKIYVIRFQDGTSTRAIHRTLMDAKKDATSRIKYAAGDLHLEDLSTGQIWCRKQFRNLNRWGYTKWMKQE